MGNSAIGCAGDWARAGLGETARGGRSRRARWGRERGRARGREETGGVERRLTTRRARA